MSMRSRGATVSAPPLKCPEVIPVQRQPSVSPSRTAPADDVLLAASARAGDRSAWEQLVNQYLPIVWQVAEKQGLAASDCVDAVQMTWLRLLQDGHHFIDAARLEEWLVTTCRQESQRVAAVRRWRTPPAVVAMPWVVGETA